MSKYNELSNNPPRLDIKGKPRQIKINLISVMCDNKYRWVIKKDEHGDYRISTMGYSFRNFQTKYYKDDIEWEMDEGNWDEAFRMINSGTILIEKIQYR